jgi:hypothetical protein
VTFWLTAKHDGCLDQQGSLVLATVRRTLLGLQGHGFVAEVNTYSTEGKTVWSYRPGSENGGDVLQGLMDLVLTLAPSSWELRSGVDVSG